MLSLVAGRDLARQDAEFVDVPITDEHFDRGQYFLTVASSLVITSPLAQQMIEQIDGFPIRIVSHDPTPPHTTPPTSGPIVAVRWRDVIGGWSLDQGAISGASCSGTGSWRATTLPDSSQRVIPRLGFWAISASYNRRATL